MADANNLWMAFMAHRDCLAEEISPFYCVTDCKAKTEAFGEALRSVLRNEGIPFSGSSEEALLNSTVDHLRSLLSAVISASNDVARICEGCDIQTVKLMRYMLDQLSDDIRLTAADLMATLIKRLQQAPSPLISLSELTTIVGAEGDDKTKGQALLENIAAQQANYNSLASIVQTLFDIVGIEQEEGFRNELGSGCLRDAETRDSLSKFVDEMILPIVNQLRKTAVLIEGGTLEPIDVTHQETLYNLSSSLELMRALILGSQGRFVMCILPSSFERIRAPIEPCKGSSISAPDAQVDWLTVMLEDPFEEVIPWIAAGTAFVVLMTLGACFGYYWLARCRGENVRWFRELTPNR